MSTFVHPINLTFGGAHYWSDIYFQGGYWDYSVQPHRAMTEPASWYRTVGQWQFFLNNGPASDPGYIDKIPPTFAQGWQFPGGGGSTKLTNLPAFDIFTAPYTDPNAYSGRGMGGSFWVDIAGGDGAAAMPEWAENPRIRFRLTYPNGQRIGGLTSDYTSSEPPFPAIGGAGAYASRLISTTVSGGVVEAVWELDVEPYTAFLGRHLVVDCYRSGDGSVVAEQHLQVASIEAWQVYDRTLTTDGAWPLRQRQSLTGTPSWPLRQRQNGGHSGSWALRQRQTGM